MELTASTQTPWNRAPTSGRVPQYCTPRDYPLPFSGSALLVPDLVGTLGSSVTVSYLMFKPMKFIHVKM